jgi:hypothetical protein
MKHQNKVEQKLNASLKSLPNGLASDPWGTDEQAYHSRARALSKLRIKYWPKSLSEESLEQRFSNIDSLAMKLSGNSTVLRATRLILPTTIAADAFREKNTVKQLEELIDQNELVMFPVGIEISPQGIGIQSLYKICTGYKWFVTGFSGPEGDDRLTAHYNFYEKSIKATKKLAKKIGAYGVNYYLSEPDSDTFKNELISSGFHSTGTTKFNDPSYGPINRFLYKT